MPCPFCILSVRDPNGVGYDAVYDPLGRMTSQTDTWGDTVSMTYDREGNVLTQTDAKGKVTTMVYDARNRRKTVTDRLAAMTTFNYHPAGHLASIVDAEGQMTAYEHNARGEKIKETYPDHVNGAGVGTPGYGIVQFDYDPAGRMLRKTDQVGDSVYFNYDMAGRVPQRDYRTAANSPNGPIADSDTFQFDVAGRMTSATSGRYTNVLGMTYDHAGRLSTESLSIAGQTYTVTREYDALNRIKKYIYPDGTQVERTYTDRGQLATIKYNGSVIDTRTYDLGGRFSTSTYSNGCVTTHTYRSSGSQKDNLLASIATTNPGPNKVGIYSYTWDANKNKTAETITNSPLSTHGFSTGATGYDDENRVTNWARSDSFQTQTWSLSPVGDWNTFTQTGTAAISQTRTHGPTHEFTSFTGTSGGNPANGTLTYDVKGNLTHRPATLAAPELNLSWDFDNRLIGADTNGSPGSLEVNYQYDALGRRVARTESGSTVIYFQAGQQTILDYASGAAPNSPTYRYVFGSYVDEPEMRETASGSVKHFYHRNQQYSITALTDNNGNTAERYAYTACGALSIFDSVGSPLTSSSQSSRIAFTGREWDPALLLHYFRARWLDLAAGRFCSRDLMVYASGFDLYSAELSLSKADPTGNLIVSDILPPPLPSTDHYAYHLEKKWTSECKRGTITIDNDDLWYYLSAWTWDRYRSRQPRDNWWEYFYPQSFVPFSDERVEFNRGCIGIAGCFIGAPIRFDKDSFFKHCFGSLDQAKAFAKKLNDKNVCGCTNNPSGGRARAVVFGYTAWKKRETLSEYLGKLESSGSMASICNHCGKINWGDTQGPYFGDSFDFGYYHERLNCFFHAETGLSSGGRARVSLPSDFAPCPVAIYCVTCEGDGTGFGPCIVSDAK